MSSCDATARSSRASAFVGEGIDVADLAEERDQGQTDEPFVVADDPLHVQLRAFVQDHNHGLLGDGEVTDNRRDADHERPLCLVTDRCELTVEQRDLRCLHDVASVVRLSRLQEEERFDVAEDGKADRGRRFPNPAAPNGGVNPKLPLFKRMSKSAVGRAAIPSHPTTTLGPSSS